MVFYVRLTFLKNDMSNGSGGLMKVNINFQALRDRSKLGDKVDKIKRCIH